MHTIRVDLKDRSYPIYIGSNIVTRIGHLLSRANLGKDAFIITNPLIKRVCSASLDTSLRRKGIRPHYILIADSEQAKSLDTVKAVLHAICLQSRSGTPFIAALGGGVVGDLAGFVAAIYKRGVPYVQIPTTLLAQVDSAIGGKTAVDLPEGKNLAGVFYQPRMVISDTAFIRSLDKQHLRSGMAEIIKYAVIRDAVLFAYLEKNLAGALEAKPSVLEDIIKRCSKIKAEIVSKDEREKKGLRTVLNFGHTIGHAIETAGGYKKYSHGEAIALGMLAAADISCRMNLTKEREKDRLSRLLRLAGLPGRIEGVKGDDIIDAHYRDKKFFARKNRFVLMSRIGSVRVVENIPLKHIKASVESLIG